MAGVEFVCFGSGSGALGSIRGVTNSQVGAGPPSASGAIERAIFLQHAEWFEYLRSAAATGAFDLVELPSYFPFGQLVKEMLGVRLRLVLHGVNSHLLAAS